MSKSKQVFENEQERYQDTTMFDADYHYQRYINQLQYMEDGKTIPGHIADVHTQNIPGFLN